MTEFTSTDSLTGLTVSDLGNGLGKEGRDAGKSELFPCQFVRELYMFNFIVGM
jgi:hypothetical protein